MMKISERRTCLHIAICKSVGDGVFFYFLLGFLGVTLDFTRVAKKKS